MHSDSAACSDQSSAVASPAYLAMNLGAHAGGGGRKFSHSSVDAIVSSAPSSVNSSAVTANRSGFGDASFEWDDLGHMTPSTRGSEVSLTFNEPRSASMHSLKPLLEGEQERPLSLNQRYHLAQLDMLSKQLEVIEEELMRKESIALVEVRHKDVHQHTTSSAPREKHVMFSELRSSFAFANKKKKKLNKGAGAQHSSSSDSKADAAPSKSILQKSDAPHHHGGGGGAQKAEKPQYDTLPCRE